MKSSSHIAHNIKVHDKAARQYEKLHTEIFNEIEQTRLNEDLRKAVKEIGGSGDNKKALDVGCGSGNLTRHLLEFGFRVTATDVSEKFLSLVGKRFEGKSIELKKINGYDLSGISSGSYDFTATYSVLHHVPDYLEMVGEMVRVTKSGGLIYIDHEKSENFWQNNPILEEFYSEQENIVKFKKIGRLLSPRFYINRLKRLANPRFQAEGDIHVFPDDHIEWDKIKGAFQESGVEVIMENDYLNFNSLYDPEIYEEYQNKTSDTKVLVGRKR